MSPTRYWVLGSAMFASALFSAGCDKSKSSGENDKGNVNVHVNTPGGDYGVHVEYPKHRDSDQETKVKVEHN